MAASLSSWMLLLVVLLVSSFILMASATSSEIYESRGVKSENGGEEYRTEKGITISNWMKKYLFMLQNWYHGTVSTNLKPARHILILIILFVTEKRPFFVGSRYGRSQSDLTNMDENGKSNSMARIVPRTDRFFFGSRYGKRSLPEAAVDVEQNQLLTCFYTGVTNIFRCVEYVKLMQEISENK